jgi:4-amino-4-deoxychorismate lyase
MADFQLFTTIRYDPALLNVSPGSHVPEWNRKLSPWYMLDYHRDRMVRAAEHFGWAAAVTTLSGEEGMTRLEEFVAQVASMITDSAPHRVKILLDESGRLSSELGATPEVPPENLFPTHLPKPDDDDSSSSNTMMDAQQPWTPTKTPAKTPAWEVSVDSDVTVHSAFTHHKTTNRHMYDDARWRRQLAPTTPLRDVLLVNQAHGCVMETSISTPYFWRRGRWVTPPVSQGGFRQWNGGGGNDGTSRRWALASGLAEEEMVPVASLRDGEACWLSNGLRGFMFAHVKVPPNSEALFC